MLKRSLLEIWGTTWREIYLVAGAFDLPVLRLFPDRGASSGHPRLLLPGRGTGEPHVDRDALRTTLLIDGGNQTPDNRDARRFLALANQFGITQIDYLVVTHYHGDHYGATPEISRHIRIVNWADHGPNVEDDRDEEWQKHWIIKCDEPLYAE